MKGFKIVEIIKVVLDDILLELHFNIEFLNKKSSFSLRITEDGETILFVRKEEWIKLLDFNYELYLVLSIVKDSDELGRLLENEINFIQFGMGKALNSNENLMYYFKISSNENNFLFFNNGDRGAYSFDNIDEILKNDIYGYHWVEG